MVLVFGELPSFVRMILQIEENKGVELTVYVQWSEMDHQNAPLGMKGWLRATKLPGYLEGEAARRRKTHCLDWSA